jgi:hypothetical protein
VVPAFLIVALHPTERFVARLGAGHAPAGGLLDRVAHALTRALLWHVAFRVFGWALPLVLVAVLTAVGWRAAGRARRRRARSPPRR